MHRQVYSFLHAMRAAYPASFRGKILECGSLNINGSPRGFFDASEYVGVDWRAGKDVDVVALVHEYHEKPDGYFSVVISTEMLEHDPHWERSLRRMTELLMPGGTLIVTTAGPGRAPHEIETSPQKSYYQNLQLMDLSQGALSVSRFRRVVLEDDLESNDVRLFAAGKM
jgi:SAM-dependent methyltransferase